MLEHSTGYATEQAIRSFDVSRNYVVIPKGTSMVKLTLEVPALKTDANGKALPGQDCSGVELMALLGNNSTAPFTSRAAARVMNCASDGSAVTDPAKRKIEYSTLSPLPGVWDLHVFGLYMYAHSGFTLKVDYVNATASPARSRAPCSALRGTEELKIGDSSFAAQPDSAKSTFELNGLYAETPSQVANDDACLVPGSVPGVLRKYPSGTQSVKFTTGGSAGNDIDLFVFECDAKATTPDDKSCEIAGKSDRPHRRRVGHSRAQRRQSLRGARRRLHRQRRGHVHHERDDPAGVRKGQRFGQRRGAGLQDRLRFQRSSKWLRASC